MMNSDRWCLEDVVAVDDSVEDVKDGVDGDGERGRTTARTQLGKPDQRAEHHRRLVERLQQSNAHVGDAASCLITSIGLV